MTQHDDDLRFSRRRALQGLLTASAASVIGCGPSDTAPDDASATDAAASDAFRPRDAGTDADRGWDAGPAPTGPFQHGVASGDPWPESVILWTRVSEQTGSVSVAWEVSASPSFETLIASGTATTDDSRDYTVKVEATGLAPATTYYYRFTFGDVASPIGRTRTAPANEAEVARLRFAVCSCASYAHGFFHVYRDIAARADLDAVLHLGDYIYEYGTGEYGDVREYDPPHEILTLDDYRRRYRHYRLDADLQEAHRQHPFITTWDDHESANNSYRDGAENHTESTEGRWADRLAAAAQAYREWLPFRETLEEGRLRLYRTLRYGDLADLVFLDTRIWDRDLQATGSDDPTLTSETRRLTGPTQLAWVSEELNASTARWKLVCQQVMMGQLKLALNTDQWDGYPAQREAFFDAIEGQVDDVVVLTGDIHSSWAHDLSRNPDDAEIYDPATGAGSMAVELVCPGVAAPGLTRAASELVAPMIASGMPHTKYFDGYQRGYIVLDLDASRAQGAWVHVEDVERVDGNTATIDGVVETATGTNHLRVVDTAAAPRTDAPDLAP